MGPGPEILVVAGVSHRTASAAMRDRLFIPDAELDAFEAALAARGVTRAIVMSTCDRIEVQACHADPAAVNTAVAELLRARAGDDPPRGEQVYLKTGTAAIRHVFAVAASLDSQIIGEPGVLGQVKAAWARAQKSGRMGGLLDRSLQAAFAAAKRVRAETAIGERPTSLAAAAIQLARDVHGDLTGITLVLAGTGDMGEALIENFRAAGVRRVVVAAPSIARAQELARRLGCHVAELDAAGALFDRADVLMTAAGTGQVLVDAPAIAASMRRRASRPMLIIDLGVPPDADPAIDRLDDVFRYDLDDLERMALSGRLSREDAARAAEAILEAEVAAFARDHDQRAAGASIVALREHFEAVRREVLAQAGGDAERATELLLQRLLHAPSQALRARAGDGASDADLAALLRDLFGIDDRMKR